MPVITPYWWPSGSLFAYQTATILCGFATKNFTKQPSRDFCSMSQNLIRPDQTSVNAPTWGPAANHRFRRLSEPRWGGVGGPPRSHINASPRWTRTDLQGRRLLKLPKRALNQSPNRAKWLLKGVQELLKNASKRIDGLWAVPIRARSTGEPEQICGVDGS